MSFFKTGRGTSCTFGQMKGVLLHVRSKLFLLLAIFVSGCVTLYKPNAVNSPILSEKGDANATYSIGVSGSGLYNLQGAYAITNHVGLMLNGMLHQRKTNSTGSKEDLNLYFAETGAGYYLRAGEGKTAQIHCFGGGGYGNSMDRIYIPGDPVRKMQGQFVNLFFQPGMAYVNENFSLALDMRFNYVNVYHISAPLYTDFAFWNTNLQYHPDTSLSFANLEPAVTMRVGGAKVKFNMQIGAILPFYKPEAFMTVNTASLLAIPLVKFSFGINYNFGLMRNRRTVINTEN